MTALKAGEVEAFLRRPDPRYPLVLIYGPDQGLVSERARLLARSAVENPDDPFQLIRMDGDQLASDPMRLVDEAHTVPMFGGKRSIWVRMGNNPLAEAIGQLCSVPPRDVLIVLEAGELTPKSPLRSLIEKASTAAALPWLGCCHHSTHAEPAHTTAAANRRHRAVRARTRRTEARRPQTAPQRE